MSDLLPYLAGGIPTAGAGWLLLRRYGSLLWKNRRRIEQVVEVALGEDTTLTTTTRTDDPADLAPTGPDGMTALAAALTEQMRGLRDHVTFLDGRMDRLEQLVEDRDARIDALEKELERLREENRRVKGENADLRARIRELEAEIATLKGT